MVQINKILSREKIASRRAKSLPQTKFFSPFAGQFLTNRYLYKSLIILLDSIPQGIRAYFIGSTKSTKKVLGLFTSNVM